MNPEDLTVNDYLEIKGKVKEGTNIPTKFNSMEDISDFIKKHKR